MKVKKKEAVDALIADVQTIQGLTDEIINMLLGGGCHKNDILENSEDILKLSVNLEKKLEKITKS